MSRAADIDHVQVVFLDQAVGVGIDEVQSGRGAPVPEQARLDVFDGKRLGQQGVRQKINLTDGKIVGGAPVSVETAGSLSAKGFGVREGMEG